MKGAWQDWPREGWIWLIVSLVMLGIGLLKSINLVILLASFLLVTFLINLTLGRKQLRGIEAARRLPELFFAGTPFPWTIQVRNTGSHDRQGLCFRELFPGVGWFQSLLTGKECRHLYQETAFSHRGRFPIGPLVAQTGYPLGLVTFTQVLEPAREVVVFPRLGHLHTWELQRWLERQSVAAGSVRTYSQRHPNAQTDFHGLRNYQPGDSTRWIHWRTSARRGELMVREFEQPPNQNLLLFVQVSGTPSLLERTLSLAGTIVWEWCQERGSRLLLGLAGRKPVVLQGLTDASLAVSMLTALADTEAAESGAVETLLHRMEDIPAFPASILVLGGAEFALALADGLGRGTAWLDVSAHEEEAFFDLPGDEKRE